MRNDAKRDLASGHGVLPTAKLRWKGLAGATALLLIVIGGAFYAYPGEGAAERLQDHAVRVVHGHPKDPGSVAFTGNTGLYLGNGLVLTAAHVAGSPSGPEPIGILAGDSFIAAQFVKAGAFDTLDATLLLVDQHALPEPIRSLPRLSFCRRSSTLGQMVDIVEPRRVTHSVIVSPEVLPPGVSWKFATLIRDVASTGNSGSGVFDHKTGCLMGIMSRKIEKTLRTPNAPSQTEGIAKYFVPVDQIIATFGSALGPALPE